MRNAEITVHGVGARADRALVLTDRTDEARKRATEALRAAGLAGRCWWAARDREPARWRLMVAEGAWDEMAVTLHAAGVGYEEVTR